MNVYKAKIRAMYLKANEQKFVSSKLPKRFYVTKHLEERLNERHVKVGMSFFRKNAKLENLLDIQVTTDNKVTYLFRVKMTEKTYLMFVVSQKGQVLTVWKDTDKCRKTNSGIHTNDFSVYENAI